MLLQALTLIHHITTMLFGIFLSAFFLGAKQDRKNILLLLSTGAVSGLLYYPVVLALGTSWADPIYPLLVHLPLFLLLVFYYKYRWLPALVSILTAYLCCQFSNWAGILAFSICGLDWVYYLTRILTTCAVFYLLSRHLCQTTALLLSKSDRDLYILGAMPLVYYLFDYVTTKFSTLLYSGSKVVVEFLAFSMCLSYVIFLLVYFQEYELKNRAEELEELKEAAIVENDFGKAADYKKEQVEVRQKFEQQRKRLQKKAGENATKVREEDIAEVVALWTRIPVQRLAEKESHRLLKLEHTLHQRVVGQDEAVQAVAKAIRRGRVGLKDPKRPIGSFLFLGPTGVGKTELSKTLAEVVFGSEQAMIRVDMSEYMEKHSVSKLVGSPPGYVGYEEGGQLSEKVRRNPYSVILFDEIEKAHPDVFNILLQVLDDGHITDSRGRKVDFKNTILIMTSNAGASSIMSPKKLGFAAVDDEKRNYQVMKDNVMEEVRRIFKPEFLNRIDEIIVFHSLNKDHVKKIAGILLNEFSRRCKEQLNITLEVRPSAKELISEAGFDEKYGARPLKRAIQTKVEDALAQEILEGRVKAGDTVAVGVSKKEVKFVVKNHKELEKNDDL